MAASKKSTGYSAKYAAGVLPFFGDEVLLGLEYRKRQGTYVWIDFSGKGDPEETFAETASRECYEETAGLLNIPISKITSAEKAGHFVDHTDPETGFFYRIYCIKLNEKISVEEFRNLGEKIEIKYFKIKDVLMQTDRSIYGAEFDRIRSLSSKKFIRDITLDSTLESKVDLSIEIDNSTSTSTLESNTGNVLPSTFTSTVESNIISNTRNLNCGICGICGYPLEVLNNPYNTGNVVYNNPHHIEICWKCAGNMKTNFISKCDECGGLMDGDDCSGEICLDCDLYDCFCDPPMDDFKSTVFTSTSTSTSTSASTSASTSTSTVESTVVSNIISKTGNESSNLKSKCKECGDLMDSDGSFCLNCEDCNRKTCLDCDPYDCFCDPTLDLMWMDDFKSTVFTPTSTSIIDSTVVSNAGNVVLNTVNIISERKIPKSAECRCQMLNDDSLSMICKNFDSIYCFCDPPILTSTSTSTSTSTIDSIVGSNVGNVGSTVVSNVGSIPGNLISNQKSPKCVECRCPMGDSYGLICEDCNGKKCLDCDSLNCSCDS